MKTFQINPVDSRKSFYNKCHVNQYTTEDGQEYLDLVSYGTRVAYFNKTENFISINGGFSVTTARHINAFLDFCGVPPMTKKQMDAKPSFQVN